VAILWSAIYYITETLLKVTLNTIVLTPVLGLWCSCSQRFSYYLAF